MLLKENLRVRMHFGVFSRQRLCRKDMNTISYSAGLAPSPLWVASELGQTSISMLSPLFIEGAVTGAILPTQLASAAHFFLSLQLSQSYACSSHDMLVHVSNYL